ncbi:helix-turn-helix domain-containing protein [Pediococcus pentosaceus]|uniref:helix-turn-helix domain-containing protein n=1 Tax=Pediococcus pentosaceus TaxID=1255 RepID=UPI0021A664A0|nr:helix-turn-helix domain-containing protein [Pediococcus pentosaceus]MCT3033263.1 DNA-binding protein [Pediococcus pentosaceus]
MQLEMELPEKTINQLQVIMLDTAIKAYKEAGRRKQFGAYLTKAEASQYLHVSYTTLNELIKMGLRIVVIGNIQRISKKECDRFMNEHQK